MTPVEAAVRAAIERRGPLGFDEVMAAALYHPEAGFYASGGRAGRGGGDFITSPEVGALFGAVVARALDRWWRRAGEPSVFVVVEVGAGPGTLARTVLRAAPACLPALRYVLVESSAAQRALHGQHLALESPAAAFASPPDPDDDLVTTRTPAGPIVVSLAELPRLPGPCTVLANELLDNLPVRLAERSAAGWHEVRVGLEAGALTEVAVSLGAADAQRLSMLAPDAEPGARVPLPRTAARWVRDALALAGPEGRVVAIDYGEPTARLAARPPAEWLRTYRRHERGGTPLDGLGTQDITCEVAIDQLDPRPARDRSQAEWLQAHGIDELVADARRTWGERAGIGDLEALRARSRITEADALLDPAGLGAFRVLEWGPDDDA